MYVIESSQSFYGVAAVPVDENTLYALIENKVIHEDSTISDTASWLSRQVIADELVVFHCSLQAWVEEQPIKRPSKPVDTQKTSEKKT